MEIGELEAERHVKYILSVDENKEDVESVAMDHLRLNGAYWGLTTLDLLHKLSVDRDEVVSWVMECQHECGGFGGNVGHDPHILYTLSAVHILVLIDKLDVLDVDKVSDWSEINTNDTRPVAASFAIHIDWPALLDIATLQNEDGSFSGDIWGETDTRFSYCAICCLSLLHHLDKINVDKAVDYIVSCKNFDGGFGCTPRAESHAGQRPTWVWLCEREVKSGGLNGRPEKLPDVCYSWWVLSSLIMIDRVHWIDKNKLAKFILDCQDKENGGISDRPDDAVDVFHTYLGVAGLALLEYPGLKAIDPAYALPVDVVNKLFFGR